MRSEVISAPSLTLQKLRTDREQGLGMRPAIFFTLVIVLYGNLVNLLPQDLHTTIYVPLNAIVGMLVGIVTWRLLGLDLTQMLQHRRGILRGILIGSAIGLLIVAPVYVGLLVPGFREIVAGDIRHAGLSTVGFLYAALVRIPIGTALFEEWIFRGVLFAVWLKAGNMRAAFLVPSAAFGLWHIASTVQLFEVTRPGLPAGPVALFVLGAVIVTFIAGILFTLIRQDSRGVLGPTITHAIINSLALTATYVARGL